MLASLMCVLLLSAPPTPAHDVEFWRAIARGDHAVPEGESAGALLVELSSLLGSPDPEIRDGLGYGIAARWIYSRGLVGPDDLRTLLDLWTANLRAGIGSSGDDSVLLRSFSALDLSILAAYDIKSPFLTRDEFAGLLDAALRYLADEKDLRGYETGKGWFHAAAHTADLLKFLGRSRYLQPGEQQRILDAIAAKLEAPVYVWGEDERLARAVLSLLGREDLDGEAFAAWLARLQGRADGLWEGELDPARFAAVQNARNLLRSLYVILASMEERSGAMEKAREQVLETLKKM